MKIKYTCNKNKYHTEINEYNDYPVSQKPCTYCLFDCDGIMLAEELI
jgi:hypothetical protein